MTIELLQRLSMIAYVLAAVLFVIAVVLFFVLKIPMLFGELTGATARKGVEAIRQQTLSGEQSAYLTKKAKSRKQQRSEDNELPKKAGGRDETGKLDTAVLSQHAAAQGAVGSETVLLSQTTPSFESGETAPLYGGTSTTEYVADAGETAVLYAPTVGPTGGDNTGETALLYQQTPEPMEESSAGETAALYYQKGGEWEANDYSGETTALSWQDPQSNAEETVPQNDSVTLDVEMGFLGSSELIE